MVEKTWKALFRSPNVKVTELELFMGTVNLIARTYKLRGICVNCQSRGSGISIPQGYPQPFDTHGMVSDSKSKTWRIFPEKTQ